MPSLARDPCGPSSAQPLVFARRVLWVDEILPVECRVAGQRMPGLHGQFCRRDRPRAPCNVDWQNFVHAATLRARRPTLIRGCGVAPTPVHRLPYGCTGSRRYWQNFFHQPSRPIVSSCRDQVSRGAGRPVACSRLQPRSCILEAAASWLQPLGCSLEMAASRLQLGRCNVKDTTSRLQPRCCSLAAAASQPRGCSLEAAASRLQPRG